MTEVTEENYGEESLEAEAETEEVDENLENNNIDDQTILEIIEIFAEEKEGFYYGRQDKIGSKDECISWVKDTLRKSIES